MRSFAIDQSYGSEAILEESGPIALGAIPEETCHAGDTIRICLQCSLPALDCVCGHE